MKKVFFVAGEASGDVHAAEVIEAMLAADPDVDVHGYGGERMKEAGARIHYPLPDLASVGSDWIWKIFEFRKIGLRIFDLCREHSIDTIVLVDFPGFNLRVATAARKAGMRVIYYITPQVWAWRAGRLKRMRRDIDQALVILPFEEPLLSEAGIPTKFVGHPLVDQLGTIREPAAIREEAGLPADLDIPLVGLMPGSRKREVIRLAPVLVETARLLLRENPNLQFVVPRADTISAELLDASFGETIPWTRVDEPARDLRASFRVCVTKSGTSTLENALLGVPQVVIYKTRALDAFVAKRVVKIPWIGLVNILADQEICPEFLQENCIGEKIARGASPLLEEGPARTEMLEALGEVAESLGEGNSAKRAADLILERVKS